MFVKSTLPSGHGCVRRKERSDSGCLMAKIAKVQCELRSRRPRGTRAGTPGQELLGLQGPRPGAIHNKAPPQPWACERAATAKLAHFGLGPPSTPWAPYFNSAFHRGDVSEMVTLRG